MAEEGNRTLLIPPELGYMNHYDSSRGLVDETKSILMAVTLKSIGNPYLRKQIQIRKAEVLEENRKFLEQYYQDNEYVEDEYARHGFFVEEYRSKNRSKNAV